MDETQKLHVGYLRESQDRSGTGKAIARHKRKCVERGDAIGWSIDKWFVDNDISAYGSRKRPGFDALMELVREGRVAGIMCWAMDRVHKDHVVLEEYIALVEKHDIELQAALEAPFDLNTAAGRRDARSACTAARFESERKSERHKDAAEEKAFAGEHNGGLRQFGYVDAARSALVEVEADAGRGAVALLLRGGTRADAVRHLNSLTRTPLRGPGKRPKEWDTDPERPVYGPPPPYGGVPWTVVKLERWVRSAAIAGKREHLGKVVADADWPAIISWDEHERVCAELDQRQYQQRRPARAYLLSNFATCARCGTPLIAQPYRDRPAYRCPQSNRTVNGRKGCGGARIYTDDIDELVVNFAMRLAVDPDRIAHDEKRARDRSADELNARRQLDRLATREANLADAAVEGMPRDQFRRKQLELNDEREFLEAKLAELTSALEPALIDGSTSTEARRRFDTLTINQQRHVLRGLLRSVVVRGFREAQRSGQARVEVFPEWSAAVEKAKTIEGAVFEPRIVEVEHSDPDPIPTPATHV